jgi:hypothetical protein
MVVAVVAAGVTLKVVFGVEAVEGGGREGQTALIFLSSRERPPQQAFSPCWRGQTWAMF